VLFAFGVISSLRSRYYASRYLLTSFTIFAPACRRQVRRYYASRYYACGVISSLRSRYYAARY